MTLNVTRVIQIFNIQGVLMKRAGFTMIELIFVIVILGILSAVALPKFIGVSEQAQAGKCQAFVGTLNRTIGSAMWSNAIMNGNGGSLIAEYTNAAGVKTEIANQIDIPTECDDATNGNAYGASFTLSIGNKSYDINFTDGNATSAPEWTWTQN